jgi:hypothetical protein
MIDMAAYDSSHKNPFSARANQKFERLAELLRGELKLHCYRILGSVQNMESPPYCADVATAIVEIVTNPDRQKGKVFIVSGKGLRAVAA